MVLIGYVRIVFFCLGISVYLVNYPIAKACDLMLTRKEDNCEKCLCESRSFKH